MASVNTDLNTAKKIKVDVACGARGGRVRRGGDEIGGRDLRPDPSVCKYRVNVRFALQRYSLAPPRP